MLDLTEYIKALAASYDIDEPGFVVDISRFLVSNNWFGEHPEENDGKVYVSDSFAERYGPNLDEFCSCYGLDYKSKVSRLDAILKTDMPKTAKFLRQYAKDAALSESVVYSLVDFLLYCLPGEIDESTDKEIGALVEDGAELLPKVYGDILTNFVNWVKTHTKTNYNGVYFMEKYSANDESTSAYTPDGYLEILYHLYNAEYIEKNDMYAQAAGSKNYADAWLYLALHFLCALRNTDLQRLPHPRLHSKPSDMLAKIENGEFSDDEARLTLYSVTWALEAIMPVPNKTQRYSGVAGIKLHVPQSVEVHIGTLFSAAEAHFQLTTSDSDKPLIRVISTYEQISHYMGDEIGDLFLESNFHSRAANKSYMQMIYLLTDDILSINDEFNVKGYMLASIARSHKGSYGDFAKTTSIYLKDAKMSGYTPEFVAKELFERGVLSSIPSMLLKMVTNGEYNKLSVGNQTKLMQSLNMSPLDIERSVEIMQLNMRRSVTTVNSVYQGLTKEQILNVLHRIGNGAAVSKCDSCLCLMTAMRIPCPYQDNGNCPSCEFEISTKSTMFLMARECRRLMNLYESTDNVVEKERSKAMAQTVIIPAIEEMLTVIEESYGKEAIESLEKIISEAF